MLPTYLTLLILWVDIWDFDWVFRLDLASLLASSDFGSYVDAPAPSMLPVLSVPVLHLKYFGVTTDD